MNEIPLPVRQRIETLHSTPANTAVVQPLLTMLNAPTEEIDLRGIERLVSYDNSLAMQFLRFANSPLFGTCNVDSIRSAIGVLGIRRIQTILLSCSMTHLFPMKEWVLDPFDYWRHALGCALVARRIADRVGFQEPEKAYLAGLLHDIGILVNSAVCKEDYRRCLDLARDSACSLDFAEHQILGFTHSDTGQLLASSWRIPQELVSVIHTHHEPCGENVTALTCIVHLSDLLCRVRNLGYGYYENLRIDLCCEGAWRTLSQSCPALAQMDLARFTMDIDGAMDEITALVNSVFGR